MIERITPEEVYRLHVEEVNGEGIVPTLHFLELSDMAIQMYEIEADLLNQNLDTDSPDVAS